MSQYFQKIFCKIVTRLDDGILIQFYIFSFCLFYYLKLNSKTVKLVFFPFLNVENKLNKKRVFYLKVNIEKSYSLLCFQHWINIIKLLDADFVIVCDSLSLKYIILKHIKFKNSNIKFIKSNRVYEQHIKNFFDGRWVKAACAHLTTYFHSNLNNVEKIWNIDADDTMILLPPQECVKIIERVELDAELKGYDCYSLDMWRSRTKGKHWSYGITYIQRPKKFLDCFYNFCVDESPFLNKKELCYNTSFNIDWFVTFLKNSNLIIAETFYVENMCFIHWAHNLFLEQVISNCLVIWKENQIYYPIIKALMQSDKYAFINISKDCIKYDFNLTEQQGITFLCDYVIRLEKYPEALKLLWQLN